ncbi:microrchidia 7-like protein [Tanacetum coccineum]|uniref:Microrchidia 7-like protein n=1 Tax=Tanacetum coccineum TaxID=301880 RepID=A0ABQ4Y241_9ASTR
MSCRKSYRRVDGKTAFESPEMLSPSLHKSSVILKIFCIHILPWQSLKGATKKQKYEKLYEKKVATPIESYASILYLRIPDNFRIILRGKDVIHHNIVNDMMTSQKITYKPAQPAANGVTTNDKNQMSADVTIGFVKDAKDHIDVQGFNAYHKNRLIKPFWRVWNAAGSDGRGVTAASGGDGNNTSYGTSDYGAPGGYGNNASHGTSDYGASSGGYGNTDYG